MSLQPDHPHNYPERVEERKRVVEQGVIWIVHHLKMGQYPRSRDQIVNMDTVRLLANVTFMHTDEITEMVLTEQRMKMERFKEKERGE